MLDLADFFSDLTTTYYCVVKMSDKFPAYTTGEDVDIFCFSPDELTRKILYWGKKYVDVGYQIKVKDVHKKRHVHVDFIKDGNIEFRFDLYGQLPSYNKVAIKPALFESIIENAQSVGCAGGNAKLSLKVPSSIDEMLIRYLEFIEWYDVRPDKIKHLDYIVNNSDDSSKHNFLEKMHHYTMLPPVYLPEKKEPIFHRVMQAAKSFLSFK